MTKKYRKNLIHQEYNPKKIVKKKKVMKKKR